MMIIEYMNINQYNTHTSATILSSVDGPLFQCKGSNQKRIDPDEYSNVVLFLLSKILRLLFIFDSPQEVISQKECIPYNSRRANNKYISNGFT